VLSANRVVNYGPIAPEESRRIFAREALVYQRLRRRPDWLLANDTALRDAQQMEERLRTRDLLHGAEAFVEFYDRALPRQVSKRRDAGVFHPASVFRGTASPDPRRRTYFRPSAASPKHSNNIPKSPTSMRCPIPIEYRFAPGESRDGALLRIPATGVARTHSAPGWMPQSRICRTANRGAAALAAQGCAPEF